MKPRSKKIIALISLCFVFFFTVRAQAVVPLAVASYVAGQSLANYFYGSAALHIIGLAAGTYWYMTNKSDDSHTIDRTDNSIIRDARSTWIDVDMDSIPVVKNGKVDAKASISDLVNNAWSNPTKYPNLYAVSKKNLADTDFLSLTYNEANNNYQAGDIVKIGSTYYNITGKQVRTDRYSNYYSPPVLYQGSVVFKTPMASDPGYYSAVIYQVSSTNTVPPPKYVKKDPAVVANDIASPTNNNKVTGIYQSEIDVQLSQRSNNTPTTALPTGLSEQQVKDILAKNKQAYNAYSSAKAAIGTAQAAASAICASSFANPSDLRLKAACENAKLAAANAQTVAGSAGKDLSAATSKSITEAQEKSAAESATAALTGNNTYDSAIEAPEKKDISGMMQGFVNSSPLSAMLRSFQISTSSPLCSVNCGSVFGLDFKIDLCRYESDFNNLGSFLLIVSHGFSVLIVIRGWKGE